MELLTVAISRRHDAADLFSSVAKALMSVGLVLSGQTSQIWAGQGISKTNFHIIFCPKTKSVFVRSINSYQKQLNINSHLELKALVVLIRLKGS